MMNVVFETCKYFSWPRIAHSELVSSVCWTSPDEVYSAGDDHQVLKWNLLNNESSIIAKLPDEVYPTDMRWLPRSGGSGVKTAANASDVFALSSTDGENLFYFNRFFWFIFNGSVFLCFNSWIVYKISQAIELANIKPWSRWLELIILDSIYSLVIYSNLTFNPFDSTLHLIYTMVVRRLFPR